MYPKNLNQLPHALPLLPGQLKLPEAMFANTCELVNVIAQLDNHGQVIVS